MWICPSQPVGSYQSMSFHKCFFRYLSCQHWLPVISPVLLLYLSVLYWDVQHWETVPALKKIARNKKPPSVPQSSPLYSNISNSTALTKDSAQMQTKVNRSACWLSSNAIERKTCIGTAWGTWVTSMVDLGFLCCWWWELDFPRICQILDGLNLQSLSPEWRQSPQQVGS